MPETIYTAVATSTGEGRAGGRTRTDDGLLDLTLALPKEMGGPGGATNPEQLFASGWSSCFHSALKLVAAQQKVTMSDSAVIASISVVRADDEGLELSAALTVELGGLDQKTAEELVAAAHQVCPYSRATRGNVEVDLEVVVA